MNASWLLDPLYVDFDDCLTRYAHILSLAMPSTYDPVCTVATISLISLRIECLDLLHSNHSSAS